MVPYCRRSPRFLAFPVAQRFAPLTGWWYSENFQKKKREFMRRLLFNKRKMKTTWIRKHTVWIAGIIKSSESTVKIPMVFTAVLGKFHVAISIPYVWVKPQNLDYNIVLTLFSTKNPLPRSTNTAFYNLSWKFPISLCFFLSSKFWNTTWAYANPKLKLNNGNSVAFHTNLC